MDLEGIAHHEAGHAVVGAYLGRPIAYVAIDEQEGPLGRCSYGDRLSNVDSGFLASPEGRNRLRNELICSLAGRIAHEKFSGSSQQELAGKDRQEQVVLAVRALATLEELEILLDDGGDSQERKDLEKTLYLRSHDYIREAESEAREIVENLWDNIELLATKLLESKRVNGSEVTRLCRAS